MIIALLKIFTFNESHREALDLLQSVKGPVEVAHGCLSCGIYEGYGEEPSILYMEQWRSLPDLERHIESSVYVRILEVMELSTRLPEVSFYETDNKWHFDLVEKLRGGA